MKIIPKTSRELTLIFDELELAEYQSVAPSQHSSMNSIVYEALHEFMDKYKTKQKGV